MIYGTGFYFDDKGYYWLSKKNYDEFDARSITHFAFDLQPSIFFRKCIFSHIGYLDESFPLQFDTELFIRVSLNHEMLKIPYYLSFFRQHNRRLTKIKYAEMKYPEELVRIYSRVLCSLESQNDVQEYINIAKDLDLFIDEQIRYPINKVFDQTLIKRSFYIYLIKCCINFYEKNNLKELRNILSVLKNNFNDFYIQDFEIFVVNSIGIYFFHYCIFSLITIRYSNNKSNSSIVVLWSIDILIFFQEFSLEIPVFVNSNIIS